MWQKAIVLDVQSIRGLTNEQGRAFFRSLTMRQDREVGFQVGKLKAVNFRPGNYDFRIQVEVNPDDVPPGSVVIDTGETIPGSVPPFEAKAPTRIFKGNLSLIAVDKVIQVVEPEG